MVPRIISHNKLQPQFNPPTSELSPLRSLPPEIRNLIWDYAANWPDLSNASPDSALHDARSIAKLVQEQKTWSTPSVLLLDKQISSEALEILYAKPLVFDTLAPSALWLHVPMDIRTCISSKTLHRLRFVVIQMNLHHEHQVSGAGFWWLRNASVLIPVWWVENSLERLTIRASYTPPPREPPWTEDIRFHNTCVMRMLSMFRSFHANHAPVLFDGEISHVISD